jgi:5-methylcytosine-specific restriction enzyme A
MTTFLSTWNPMNWPWDNLDEDVAEWEQQGYYEGSWSCGNTKRIRVDNRVFLLRQGPTHRGLVASGYATTDVYEAEHWNGGLQELPWKTLVLYKM